MNDTTLKLYSNHKMDRWRSRWGNKRISRVSVELQSLATLIKITALERKCGDVSAHHLDFF